MRSYLAGFATGAAVLGSGFVLGLRAQDEPVDVVRARTVEIVDELGTTRLVLGSNEHGGAVSVKDSLGRTILLLAAGQHGGTLVMREASTLAPVVLADVGQRGGRVRVQHLESGVASMEVDAAGLRLHLGPPHSEPQVEMTAGTGVPGSLTLRNRQGDAAVHVGADETDNGALETYGPAGEPIIRLSSTAADHGLIYTCNREGQPLVRLTATAEDIGQIYTMNGDGEIQIALASHPWGPTLRLFNALGQPAVTIEPNEQGEGEVSAWSPDGTGNTLRPPVRDDVNERASGRGG